MARTRFPTVFFLLSLPVSVGLITTNYNQQPLSSLLKSKHTLRWMVNPPPVVRNRFRSANHERLTRRKAPFQPKFNRDVMVEKSHLLTFWGRGFGHGLCQRVSSYASMGRQMGMGSRQAGWLDVRLWSPRPETSISSCQVLGWHSSLSLHFLWKCLHYRIFKSLVFLLVHQPPG